MKTLYTFYNVFATAVSCGGCLALASVLVPRAVGRRMVRSFRLVTELAWTNVSAAYALDAGRAVMDGSTENEALFIAGVSQLRRELALCGFPVTQ